jgi:hypothetical protein
MLAPDFAALNPGYLLKDVDARDERGHDEERNDG